MALTIWRITPPPEGIDTALERLAHSSAHDPQYPMRNAVIELMNREIGWARRQARAIERLERRVGIPALKLPRLVSAEFGVTQIDTLAAALTEVVS